MNQEHFKELIAGKKNCPVAARLMLLLVSVPYRIVISIRNLLYDRIFKITKIDEPVISVGNITAGGTGKTPMVVWLCSYLRQKGFKPAILTRGYRTESGETDEPEMLRDKCPGSVVVVDSNRSAGAEKAIAEYGADVMVLDDGFQHRKLGRQLDIILIDATEPFGYGKVLPAGLLREPMSSLKRAGAVVITRCDQVQAAKLEETENRIANINPKIVIARAVHKPVATKDVSGKFPIEDLKGERVFAFCGIGNPKSFLNTINAIGADIAGSAVYNDHYHYNNKDIKQIIDKAKAAKAKIAVTTEKDWGKIPPELLADPDVRFVCVVVAMDFAAGGNSITELIDRAIAGKLSDKNAQNERDKIESE